MRTSDISKGYCYSNGGGGIRRVEDIKYVNNVWKVQIRVLSGVDMGNIKWITQKAFAKWALRRQSHVTDRR